MALPTKTEAIRGYVNDYYGNKSRTEKKKIRRYIEDRIYSVSYTFHNIINDEYSDAKPKIVVVGLDWTGYRDFMVFRQHLRDLGINVIHEQIQQGNYIVDQKASYRIMVASDDDIDRLKKTNPEKLLIFDKNVKTGTSLTSALKFFTDNSEELGIKTIYTMVLRDSIGISNFIVDRKGSLESLQGSRVGTRTFIQKHNQLKDMINPNKMHLIDDGIYVDDETDKETTHNRSIEKLLDLYSPQVPNIETKGLITIAEESFLKFLERRRDDRRAN